MEVGESQLAYAARLVEREHHIGFEVKSGANAMRQENYLWKKHKHLWKDMCLSIVVVTILLTQSLLT